MLITPEITFKEFEMDQSELAEKVLEQIQKKVPKASYVISGNDITFNLPSGKVNLPIKMINGRLYTNNPEFEKYISSDRKSINYVPYFELFGNLTIDLSH